MVWGVLLCISAQTLLVTSYLVSPHTDGRKGYTWYLFPGQDLNLPCDAQQPRPPDVKAITWEPPAWSRFTHNASTGGLDVLDIRLPDSGLYTCKDGAGQEHEHVVLVVEQPLSAAARVSVRYNLRKPCDPRVAGDLLKATAMEACKVPGTAVDGVCIVKTKGECRALEKSVDDYTFEFLVHCLIPSHGIEGIQQRVEAGAAKCSPPGLCVVDFPAVQTMRYREQTALLELIRKQIYAAIQQWVDQDAALMKQGFDPIETPALPIDSFARCPHSGYQWFHNVLCIPCFPGTYRMMDKPRDSTPPKCLPCSVPAQQPAYGASNCFARPTVPPVNVLVHQEIEEIPRQPYRVSVVQLVAACCGFLVLLWLMLMCLIRRRQRRAVEREKEEALLGRRPSLTSTRGSGGSSGGGGGGGGGYTSSKKSAVSSGSSHATLASEYHKGRRPKGR